MFVVSTRGLERLYHRLTELQSLLLQEKITEAIMQLFPENIIELWNRWEVRVLILVSLVLQIILTIFGARRKYTARIWIRILVWSAYLSADWVATVVLGYLARNQQDCGEDTSPKSNNFLYTFWAPFLLLHLGGPDMITAYSLEDNELWLRHFLGLIVQVGLVFYIFVRSWSNNALTYISIPIFVTGIIKYGERTFVLRSSSRQYFKDSLLSDPDPGPQFITLGHCLIERDFDIDEFREKPSATVATTSTLSLESLEASTSSSSAVPPAETSKRRDAP